MYEWTHTHVFIHTSRLIDACLHIHTYIHTFGMYACISTCMKDTCMHAHIHMDIQLCTYVYIYIHMYMQKEHVHTYILMQA